MSHSPTSRRKRGPELRDNSPREQKTFSGGRGKKKSEGGSTANGNSTPSPEISHTKTKTEAAASIGSTSPRMDAMHNRTLWVLMNLVGKYVDVEVKGGEVFEGVLHTVGLEKGLGVVLRMARKKDPNAKDKKHSTRPMDTFIIHPNDLLQIYAKDVSFDVRSEREFATDTDISSHGNYKQRELQPWMPDEEVATNVDLSMEDRHTQWDQFAVNRDKFGVTTSWNEDIYTTRLERDSAEYRNKENLAKRIAHEIEHGQSTSTNFHVLEERGIEVDIDEEQRYGAVIRTPSAPVPVFSPGGKYIPPAKRAMMKQESSKETVKEIPTSEAQTMPPPSKEVQIPSLPLSRKDSGHDLTGFSSRGSSSLTSPTSPRSPRSSPLMSPRQGETHPIISERLRIRLSLVNERLKNSTPVPAPAQPNSEKDEDEFPKRKNRSPLLSPLVGNARAINSLSLEPSTPSLEEDVLQDFCQFSRNNKKQESKRDRMLNDFKNFSKNLDPLLKKNAKPATSAQPTTTTTTPPKPAAQEPPKTDSSAKSTPKPSGAVETSAVPPEKAPTSTDSAKPKLNPDAKVFKPMSAAAPEFTPGKPAQATPSPEYDMYGQPVVDPYYFQGRPIYPGANYPYPMMQQMAMYQQMRMMQGPQPYPYPQFSYPSPVPPGQTAPKPIPQRGATSPPVGSPVQGQQLKPGQPMTAYPVPYPMPGRGMAAPYYQYAPRPGGPEAMQPYVQPSSDKANKFQGVPNTDKMATTEDRKK